MPEEVPLREHLNQRLEDFKAQYASDRQADAEAVRAALAAQEKAVDKALDASDKRFDGVNEFRSQLADQTNTFIPRAEAMAVINAISKELSEVKTTQSKMSGGSETSKWMIGLAFTAGALLIGLISFLMRKP